MSNKIILTAVILGAGLVYCAFKLNELLGPENKLEREERDITV